MSAADAEIGIRLGICLAVLLFLFASCTLHYRSFHAVLAAGRFSSTLRSAFVLGSFGFKGFTSSWVALSLKGLRYRLTSVSFNTSLAFKTRIKTHLYKQYHK